jgi:hypothetical protein
MNSQKIKVNIKRKVTFEEAISKKQDKYFDLVWYARRNWAELTHPDRGYGRRHIDIRIRATEQMLRIEMTYPQEIAKLTNTDNGDFEHGFNSGMLACLRYVTTCLDKTIDEDEGLPMGGVEAAESEFPSLDS